MRASILPPCTVIRINRLRVTVVIGCFEEEQHAPQPVDIDLCLWLPRPPVACVTDRLNDTLCYHTLSMAIRRWCETEDRRCNTLEHLADQLFRLVEEQSPGVEGIFLRLTKYPSIPGLQDGVSVTLSTLPASLHTDKPA